MLDSVLKLLKEVGPAWTFAFSVVGGVFWIGYNDPGFGKEMIQAMWPWPAALLVVTACVAVGCSRVITELISIREWLMKSTYAQEKLAETSRHNTELVLKHLLAEKEDT